MAFAVLCYKGIEDLAAREIEGLIAAKPKAKEGLVLFDCDEENLAKLSYKCQTANRVVEVIDSFSFKKGEEIIERLESLSPDIFGENIIGVSVEYVDEKEKVKGFRQEISDELIRLYRKKFRYREYDFLLVIYITYDTCYFCRDVAFDLSTRSYKLSTYGRDIKGTIAAGLVLLAECEKGSALLDAFCLNGTIAIEAGLLSSGISPWFYDKKEFRFKDLERFDLPSEKEFFVFATANQRRFSMASSKNAAAAGVDEKIAFSSLELEKLGERLGDESMDAIVANLPRITENNRRGMSRLYSSFIAESVKLLKSGGRLIAASNELSEFKKLLPDVLKQIDDRKILHGQECLHVAVFQKK